MSLVPDIQFPKKKNDELEAALRQAKTSYDEFFLIPPEDKEALQQGKIRDERCKRRVINTLVRMLNDSQQEIDRLRGLKPPVSAPKGKQKRKQKEKTHSTCYKWCPVEGCPRVRALTNTKNYTEHVGACKRRLTNKRKK